MGTHASRKPKPADEDRALRALSIITAGGTHADVVRAGIFRTPSASRMAIKRMLARRKAADIDEHREVVGEQLRGLWAALWPKVQGGDTSAVGAAVRVLEATVKLHGLAAAERHLHAVTGLTQSEFAAKAAELLAITGPGPLYDMAGLPRPEPPREDWFDPEWSNLGVQHESHCAATESSSVMPPGAQAEDYDRRPNVEEVETVEDEVVEEVVAEVVPLPPGQRTIRRGDPDFPLDANGVPEGRSGYSRRLPGIGSRGYSPLIYSGYSEIIFPNP